MPIKDHEWDPEAGQCVKALWNGQCDQHTQRVALKYIVEVLGNVNQIPLEPGDSDMTAFNSGRQWVARQIQLVLTAPQQKQVSDERRTTTVPTATERAATVNRRRNT